MIFKLFDKFNSGDNMKQKILCILTVFLLPLLFASCDESPKEVEYTHDYDSDEAAIKAICEKRGAECGEITVRIEDKLGKVNCGECNSGFVCDEIANKCTDSSDTDDPQDDSDVTESDTDNFQEDSDIPQNDSDEPIPESSLPQCSPAHSTPCKDNQSSLIWSDISTPVMDWKSAKTYCDQMSEGGYSDWRFPNIDELRTLVMNCQPTMPNGECLVSDRTECLYLECRGAAPCSCLIDESGRYNKFGDTKILWSSSRLSADEGATNEAAWGIVFRNASIAFTDIGQEYFVRCVRGENKTVYTNNNLPAEPEPDPCEPNPCYGIENAEGTCVHEDEGYSCRCNQGFVWDGITCSPTDLPECGWGDDIFPCNDQQKELIWSSKTEEKINWNEAFLYCANLEEGGLSNWRLPDIDELRTVLNGADNCEVSSESDCLSFSECRTDDDCFCGECMEEFCYAGNLGNSNYSNFDQREILWSSSQNYDDNAYAWFLDFIAGGINILDKNEELYARCVWSNNFTHNCEENYTWNGSKCAGDKKTVKCKGIPNSAEGTEYIVQTWNGTEWLPSEQSQYSEETFPNSCTFKCKNGYVWNGTACQALNFSSFQECSATSSFPCKDSSSYLVWSARTASSLDLESALNYCSIINEGGYSDWRLPNIDELRTLIINNPYTVTGGPCSVSENGCLSWTEGCDYESCVNTEYYENAFLNGEECVFSKLGDKEEFLSSSYDIDYAEQWSIYEYYVVNFLSGSVLTQSASNKYVRCVR